MKNMSDLSLSRREILQINSFMGLVNYRFKHAQQSILGVEALIV